MTLENKIKKVLATGDILAINLVFEEIFNEYKNLIYFICYQILQNEEDSNDATIETFLSFMNNIYNIDFKSIKFYLVKSATRISWRIIEKKNNNHCFDENIIRNDNKAIKQIIDGFDYLKCLEKLTKEEKGLIVMHIEYGLTLKEIAKMLNIKEKTISARYRRILKKLKKQFTNDYE
ncbi:MAG TPA: hypothetical protein DDW20_01720 [Firmicutes bacterium]|nr:hypothetical protein [Bacillota bacterium]